MRSINYELERKEDNFEVLKNKVINLIINRYNISIDEAKLAFENCMAFNYAVILPVSKEYPNGVMIATDVYRQKVAIG